MPTRALASPQFASILDGMNLISGECIAKLLRSWLPKIRNFCTNTTKCASRFALAKARTAHEFIANGCLAIQKWWRHGLPVVILMAGKSGTRVVGALRPAG